MIIKTQTLTWALLVVGNIASVATTTTPKPTFDIRLIGGFEKMSWSLYQFKKIVEYVCPIVETIAEYIKKASMLKNLCKKAEPIVETIPENINQTKIEATEKWMEVEENLMEQWA